MVYIIMKRLIFCQVSCSFDLVQFLQIMDVSINPGTCRLKLCVSCMNVIYKILPIYKSQFLGWESGREDIFLIKGFVIPLHG